MSGKIPFDKDDPQKGRWIMYDMDLKFLPTSQVT